MRYIACFLSALTVVVLLGGCATVNAFLANSPKPSVTLAGVALTDINLQSATIRFDVEVSNPYAVPLPVSNVDYSLASAGGAPFVKGTAELQTTIPAGGKKVLQLPATIGFAQVLNTVQGVRLGSVVPYDARLNFSVDAPAVGKLSLPLQKSGEFPVPNVPSIELADITWQEITADHATARLNLKIGNTNSFPVDLAALVADLTLGNTSVAQAKTQQACSFKANEAGTLQIPITVRTADLGFGILNLIRGKSSGYRLNGTVDLNSSFGPMKLPFDRAGQTAFQHGG
ncbi:MAG: LEA type 2 family protein [Phycisphaerae bacterium]